MDLIQRYCALTGQSFEAVVDEALVDFCHASIKARMEVLQNKPQVEDECNRKLLAFLN